METVILQFQTPQDFAKFRKADADCITESDISNLTITYTCGEAEIARAIKSHGATVIVRELSKN